MKIKNQQQLKKKASVIVKPKLMYDSKFSFSDYENVRKY